MAGLIDTPLPEDGPRTRPPVFGVEAHARPGAFVIAVRGELDIATTPRFEEALAAAEENGHDRLVIDLGALTFVDSAGVNALLQLHHRRLAASRDLLILPGHARVQRVFVLMGLMTTLPFLT